MPSLDNNEITFDYNIIYPVLPTPTQTPTKKYKTTTTMTSPALRGSTKIDTVPNDTISVLDLAFVTDAQETGQQPTSYELDTVRAVNKNVNLVNYYNAQSINQTTYNYKVSIWQGLDNNNGKLILVGTTSEKQGIIVVSDDISLTNFTYFIVSIPIRDIEFTSNYGSRYKNTSVMFSLVGAYRKLNDDATFGFYYQGMLNNVSLNTINKYTLEMHYGIDKIGSASYAHSTAGNFVVGNSGSLDDLKTVSWLYNINKGTYIKINFPDSLTTTTYGIVQNENGSYTIVGGYSNRVVGIKDIYPQNGKIIPYGLAYVADFTYEENIDRINFSNWSTIQYSNDLTHFEGISKTNYENVYTISSDTNNFSSKTSTAYFTKIIRENNNFTAFSWVSLDYGTQINEVGTNSSNSVTENNIVGIFFDKNNNVTPFQAEITNNNTLYIYEPLKNSYPVGSLIYIYPPNTTLSEILAEQNLPIPTPTPISDICFTRNTPIQTDQGIVSIHKIDPTVHSINNKKIIAITKSISMDNYLICFEKHALGENIPSTRTIVTKYHKIKNEHGKMIQAYKYLDYFDRVKKNDYNGEILYNILMEEHETVNVNNLICETLHPEHEIAKLYTSKYSQEDKNKIIVLMNYCKKLNNTQTYQKIVDRLSISNV